MRGTPHPGILDVASLSEGGGRGLPSQRPRPEGVSLVSLGALLELKEQTRVLIAGEQAEQHSIGELVGSGRDRKAELNQATILRYGANVLDAERGHRRDAQKVPSPRAGVFLLLDHRLHRPGWLESGAGVIDGFLGDGALRGQLGEGPVADDLAPVGEQPPDRDSVCIREVQMRPRGRVRSAGKNRAQ